jgi:hypothetical protein
MRPTASELLSHSIFDAIREKENETIAPNKVSISFDKITYNIDYYTQDVNPKAGTKADIMKYFISKLVEEYYKIKK